MGSTSNTSSSSGVDVMRNQLPSWEAFLEQFPGDQLQNNQASSSSHIPNSSFLIGHMENQMEEEEQQELGAIKEMMYKIAALQPVDIDPAMIRKPQRRNIRISDDPQSVAARHRREKISERIRILQRLVPGGTKMDTASMLDEAIQYVKFLKKQVQELQSNHHQPGVIIGHLATHNWGVAIHPVNQELSFKHSAAGSNSMGPEVCFSGDDSFCYQLV